MMSSVVTCTCALGGGTGEQETRRIRTRRGARKTARIAARARPSPDDCFRRATPGVSDLVLFHEPPQGCAAHLQLARGGRHLAVVAGESGDDHLALGA